MNSEEGCSHSRRLAVRRLAIACFVVLVLGSVIYVGVHALDEYLGGGEIEVTHSDFETEEERVEFIESVIPFPLPTGYVSIRFSLVRWQDYSFRAEVQYPESGLKAVRAAISRTLPAVADEDLSEYPFTDRQGGKGRLRLDSERNVVEIRASG